jgi:plasmid maintenance system antidote protein VapI
MTAVSDVLRKAIQESDLSIYRIAKDSGVAYPQIHHFMNERRTLQLPAVDALANYFGFELTLRAKRRSKK